MDVNRTRVGFGELAFLVFLGVGFVTGCGNPGSGNAVPTNLVTKALYEDEVKLTREDNATNEKKYIAQRSLTSGTTWTTVNANVRRNSM